MDETKVWTIKRLARCHAIVWLGVDRRRLWIRGFETETTGDFDGAEQDLQDMQRATGLEAVGVRRNTAHGVEADGATCHFAMGLAAEIGPLLIQLKAFLKRHSRDLVGDTANALCGNTATLSDGFGRVFLGHVSLCHQVEHGLVRDARMSMRGGKIRAHALLIERCELACVAINDQLFARLVPHQQTCLSVHQHRSVGVLREILKVDLTRLHQLMHKREDEQTVGAGRDADPFVCNRVIARADRVHADDLGTAFLDFADAHLDGVTVVIFGHAKEHEQLGVVPIRLTKFPERAAHRVDASSGHVHGTKATMCRIVWRAKVLRPEGCERLRLITTCEERQFLRVFCTNGR